MSTAFGDHRLLRKLASGGMGEVFLARDRTGRLLALKKLHPHLLEGDDARRLLFQEATIAARVNHPNVVQTYELGEVDGVWFISMQFVDGATLATIAAKQQLPLGLACRVVASVARGLLELHRVKDAQGRRLDALHRDVSPWNVMLGRGGQVKLIDFGVARVRTLVEHSGSMKGRAGYLSPEAVRGLPLDPRADQFSLGVVAWELLTGEPLFARESMVESLQLIGQCRVDNPQTVPGVAAAVMKALSKDPADRFPDCGAFADALEPYAAGELGPFVAALVPAELEPAFEAVKSPAARPAGVLALQSHEAMALQQLERLKGPFTLEQAEACLDLSGFPRAPPALDVVQALKQGGWLALHEVDGQLTFSVQRR